MIAYWVVPYLVVAAPPAIVLLTILIGGCTMALAPGSTTTWYFPGAVRSGVTFNTEDDVRMHCDGMSTFISP